MLSLTVQVTDAGRALITLINFGNEEAQAVIKLLGGYHIDVLKAVANGDELSCSADCFRAIGDLVEKGLLI